jgi:GntR family transcriptional regulator/MocR family aminotransferase
VLRCRLLDQGDAGLESVPVPVDEQGLWTSLLAGLDAGAILLSPAHSYPSGAVLSADRRVELLEWARETGALVIEDDYDAEALGQLTWPASSTVAASPAICGGCAPSAGPAATVCSPRSAHLPRIRPQGEAAGLHLLPRMPAGQDPGVISTAAETHGIMLEKAAWHWADPDTAPPAVLIGYGSVREDDLARGSNRSAFQLSRDPSAREVITPLWRAARRPGYRGPGTGIAR